MAQHALASKPRRARIVLRDGMSIEGGFYLNDGQALAPYLASRKGGWVNIVAAQWASEHEIHNHAVLQTDQILMASSSDGEIPVHNPTTGATARFVEIGLDDGTHVTGTLHLGQRQRLSDYLAGCGKFLPMFAARWLPRDEKMGDVALNAMCVKVVRAANAEDGAGGRAAELDPGGHRPSTAMKALNHDVVPRTSGAIEVITEGRTPDRRKRGFTPQWDVTVDIPGRVAAKLTPEQARLADWLSKHWLVQICAQAQLDPPDLRELTATPSLEDVWRGLAKRNDMTDEELAVHVAWVFMLSVANLDEASTEALKTVPAAMARTLGILPLRIEGHHIDVAVSDPSSTEIEQQLERLTNLTVRRAIATPMALRAAIAKYYPASATGSRD